MDSQLAAVEKDYVGNISHFRTDGAYYRTRELKAIKTWGGLFEQIQHRVTVLGSQQEAGDSPDVSLRFIEALFSRSGYEDYAHLL